ncbi:MAG: hypothetical protein AAGC46_06320, partial [Solirubrobacteraceae bacterium]|nr:hypothetical protein [Patulibacter sp.]
LAAAGLWTLTGSRGAAADPPAQPAVNTDAIRNKATPADATAAMANARMALAQVEACQTQTGSFAKCQTQAALGGASAGIKYVAGKPAAGQVNVTARGSGKSESYIIRAASADGKIFRIYRTEGFNVQRTCILAADRSPCPVPTW